MKTISVILTLCVLLSTCTSPNSEDYFQAGLRKYTKHKNQEAIAEYNKAIKIDSGNAKFYLYRGLAQRQIYSNDMDAVREDFNKAIRLNTKYERAYMERAIIALFKDGKYEQKNEALNNLRKVLELNPKNDSVYYWLGREERTYEKKLNAFNIYLSTHPKSYEGYIGRATAKIEKDYDGAIADYTFAISLRPNDPSAYIKRGTAKLLKDKNGAHNDWRKAGELGDPDGYTLIKYN
jgi:hypothetical protein